MFMLGIIVGLIVGLIIGMTLITLTVSNKISEIEDERDNAEYRATIHFRKLQAIERILNKAEETKEPAVFIVDKIKEVITSDETNQ